MPPALCWTSYCKRITRFWCHFVCEAIYFTFQKRYFEKVTKRNKSRFSIVSDESDAFDLAEKILKPQFILPNGQLRMFNNSGLTYKIAVNMLANLIYENK